MTDGVHNNNLPPSAQGLGNAWGRGADNALQTVLDFLFRGGSFEQAVRDAVNAGMLDPADIDLGAWSRQIEQMPAGLQRQLADTAEALPPQLREAMDAMGLTRPQPAPEASLPNTAPAAIRGEAQVAAAFANTNTAAAQAPANAAPLSAFAAQSSNPAMANGEALLPSAARTAEAPVIARTDATTLPPGADRPLPASASQPALQQAAVLAPQGRADAVPVQVLPAAAQAVPLAAGATVLVNPQGNVMAPNTVTSPRGTAEGQPAHAREGQLAPAGHTLAGHLRRDQRKGNQPPREQRGESLLALLADRRKRPDDGEGETSQFQRLFWILTIVAYGGLAVAVIALIPSGRGLVNAQGSPTLGAYALLVGGIAAAVSWMLGRKLAKG